MDEYVTWQAALSVAGAAAMVWAVNAALLRALGEIWTVKISRIATLIIAIMVTEAVAASTGVNNWAVYFLQFINGCIVSLAVIPVREEEIEVVKLAFNVSKDTVL